jgi:hypothetical protein
MKRIGILTLPFNSNCGGRLQAFALQEYLRGIGYDAHLVNLQPLHRQPDKSLKKKIKIFLNWYIRGDNKLKDLFNEAVLPANSVLYSSDDLVNLNEMFDGFVVGSDQVWRREYAGKYIDSFFLDFASEHPVRRVSYAASFGVSDWEFTPEKTNKLAKLIANFHAVSVREDSAVRLCQEFLGVEAKHVIDPTMLLGKERYLKLVENECTQNFDGELLYYVLNMNESIRSAIQSCAQELAMVPFSVNPYRRVSTSPWTDKIYPPLTSWIKSFSAARFVITDSFHGLAYAIMFNVPFLVLGNVIRGNARFPSLLKMFNLEDRQVSNYYDINLERANAPINWKAVNEILSDMRKESEEFLRLALGDR